MINKDILFIIMVIFWLLASFTAFIVFETITAASITSLSCLVIFTLITILKVFYKPFDMWLEKNIKK